MFIFTNQKRGGRKLSPGRDSCWTHNTQPERITGKYHYGSKSDVWSIGLTAYEILTGVYPYDLKKGGTFGLLALIVNGPSPRYYVLCNHPPPFHMLHMYELCLHMYTSYYSILFFSSCFFSTFYFLALSGSFIHTCIRANIPPSYVCTTYSLGEAYPQAAREFVRCCLIKEPEERPSHENLLVNFFSFYVLSN